MRSARLTCSAVLVLAIAMLFVGCAEGGAGEHHCTPGETQTCVCPGGLEGAQVCQPSGDRWGACDCSAGDSDTDSDTDTDSDMDTDTDTDTDSDTETDTGPLCEAGGVYDGSFDIRNAADLARLSGCTEITGNLEIRKAELADLRGLESLTRIGGALLLGGNTELVSLDGLDNLRSIGGSLALYGYSIGGNPALASLAGLGNLEQIGGQLVVQQADSLTDLTGLEKLTAIEDNLLLTRNASLTSLAGLQGVATIAGDVNITTNASLESLAGLEGLTDIAGGLDVSGNRALKDLSGLDKLAEIGSSGDVMPGLTISSNDSLQSLTGLESLTAVVGDLRVEQNPSLETLGSLTALESASGELLIRENAALTTLGDLIALSQAFMLNIEMNPALAQLGSLDSLTTVESINIFDNDALLDLTGLEALTSVGDLHIADNDALLALDGLDSLTTVENHLGIIGNLTLASLSGLDSLGDGGEWLEIRDNPSLSSCDVDMLVERLVAGGWTGHTEIYHNDDQGACHCTEQILDGDYEIASAEDLAGLNGYTAVTGSLSVLDATVADLHGLECLASIGGDLRIIDNASLADLTGLKTLTSVGGNLRVEGNTALVSLSGLQGLTSVAGDLMVVDNDALTSLRGLHGLIEVGGSLRIEDNAELRSLLFLQELTTLGADLSLTNNPHLPTCEAEHFRDRLIAGGWAGTATIAGNDDLAACPCPDAEIWLGDYQIQNAEDLGALSGHWLVDGDLRIQGSDLTDLTGLECLRVIDGDLIIEGNSALTGLTGLDRLESVGGGVALVSNDSLTSIAALERLVDVGVGDQFGGYFPSETGDSLTVAGNTQLENLVGLQGLTRVPGNISIIGAGVVDLTGLDNLTSIGGNLSFGFFHPYGGFIGNPNLASIKGLDRLTRIGGSLNIVASPQLLDVDGLDGLTTINGSLVIAQNAHLASLAGLGRLTHLGGECETSFPYGCIFGGFAIVDNPAVSTCDAERLLERLRDEGYQGEAMIANTDDEGPCDCAGLVFDGDYAVEDLADLEALDPYTRITGKLTITDTDLTRLSGASCLTTIDGDLEVGNNPQLERIGGLYSLTRVNGSLKLAANPVLSDLAGLDGIETLGGDLQVLDCDALRSPISLRNLTEVGGGLALEGNQSLLHLAGLAQITSLGGDISIQDNPALPTCDAEYLRDRLELRGWSGAATISGNDDGGACDCTGGVLVGDQSIDGPGQIDALAGYRAIVGDLSIGQETELEDLSALSCLTEIVGQLMVRTFETPTLTSLDGLQSLAAVSGDLRIESNLFLESLEGLDGLERVGGSLHLHDNHQLLSLAGLHGLAHLGGDSIRIQENRTLPTCEAEILLGQLAAEGWTGDIQISNNDDSGICDCPERFLEGDVVIGSAEDLEALLAVTTVNGSLSIVQSDLVEIFGMGCLTAVTGDLVISENAALRRLDGLGGLTALGGDLTVTDNPVLVTCQAEELRDRLVAAGWSGIATISGNDDVTSCECPNGTWQGDRYMMVQHEWQLEELAGYTRFTGDLFVEMPTFTDFAGLECLEVIDGMLSVMGGGDRTGGGLETFEGLHNLREIGGTLDIVENWSLQSLDGLRGLTTLRGGWLGIFANSSLPTCEAEALRDRLIANGFTGNAEIGMNDDSGTCE